MRHFDECLQLRQTLVRAGYEVELPEPDTSLTKREHIDAHLVKLRQADILLIANFDDERGSGYIGASCFFESGWAFALGKAVYTLNPINKGSVYKEDLDAIDVKLLKVMGVQ